MKRSQSILITSVLISSLVTFSAGWFFARNLGSAGNMTAQKAATIKQDGPLPTEEISVRDLNEVWASMSQSYYNTAKLDLEKLEYGAVKGFVAALEDPYTVFTTPEESQDYENKLEGQLEGIGAELEAKSGKLIVTKPLKDSPAEEAGVHAGDIIYKIDGSLAEEMTLYQAIRKIRGKQGTKVVLTLIRTSLPEPLELTITRRKITIESVTVEKLPGDLFHVTIHQFNDHTTKEFSDAVQKILLEKAKGLILDVRGNGGGYLEVSINILSELLPGQMPAVIIKERDPNKNRTQKTSGSGRLADIPMAVLVDGFSASASEIVAGALQDHKRAILIGEKTFGKGSVQEILDFKDGSELRMTIAKWFTPLDRSIDEVGIKPDREVKMTEADIDAGKDPQLDEAVKYLAK